MPNRACSDTLTPGRTGLPARRSTRGRATAPQRESARERQTGSRPFRGSSDSNSPRTRDRRSRRGMDRPPGGARCDRTVRRRPVELRALAHALAHERAILFVARPPMDVMRGGTRSGASSIASTDRSTSSPSGPTGSRSSVSSDDKGARGISPKWVCSSYAALKILPSCGEGDSRPGATR